MQGAAKDRIAGLALAALLGLLAAPVAPAQENQSPYCDRVRADQRLLDPTRTGEFVLVNLEGGGDPDGDAVQLTVLGVRQDEELTGRGDRTTPDARRSSLARGVHLRAERSRRGDGRVYFIRFRGDDGRGGSCTGVAHVSVPRWRGGWYALDSGVRVVSTAERAAARGSRRGHRRNRRGRRSPR